MIKISAVIITFNEEKNIERCIRSVIDVADEIIVLDSFSTDDTENICSRYNVRFYKSKFSEYVEQKNKALEFARFPVVLSLDADEELTGELKDSILEVKQNWDSDGYYFNRLTNFCGKWIRHSSWYPDRKLRLWDITKGKWDGRLVHEKVKMEKNAGLKFLKGDLLHYSYTSKEQFINRTIRYAQLSAKGLYMDGKKFSYVNIVFSPVWRFIKNYIIRLGFLDGRAGFIISFYMAQGVYLKYKELGDLYRTGKIES
jgi:glycosyltransferase involved in cell wall biosynthesis